MLPLNYSKKTALCQADFEKTHKFNDIGKFIFVCSDQKRKFLIEKAQNVFLL